MFSWSPLYKYGTFYLSVTLFDVHWPYIHVGAIVANVSMNILLPVIWLVCSLISLGYIPTPGYMPTMLQNRLVFSFIK